MLQLWNFVTKFNVGISTEMLQLWNGVTKAHEELIVTFLRSLGDGPFCLLAHYGAQFDVPLLISLLRQFDGENFPRNVFWSDTLQAFKELDYAEENCDISMEEPNPASGSVQTQPNPASGLIQTQRNPVSDFINSNSGGQNDCQIFESDEDLLAKIDFDAAMDEDQLQGLQVQPVVASTKVVLTASTPKRETYTAYCKSENFIIK